MKLFSKTIKIIKPVIIELFIVCTYIFVINNFIGNTENPIHSDGKGYYDYLPSIFIYQDLIRNDSPYTKDNKVYGRISKVGLYGFHNDYLVVKYPCGTALP